MTATFVSRRSVPWADSVLPPRLGPSTECRNDDGREASGGALGHVGGVDRMDDLAQLGARTLDVSIDEARYQFEVNVFGLARVTAMRST
jgi:hypothetical protein